MQILGCIRVAPTESPLLALLLVVPLGSTTHLEGWRQHSVCWFTCHLSPRQSTQLRGECKGQLSLAGDPDVKGGPGLSARHAVLGMCQALSRMPSCLSPCPAHGKLFFPIPVAIK